MCDFRGNPTICMDKKDGKIYDLPYIQGGSWAADTDWKEPGIYHVGASGCGYDHYDGTYIYNLDAYYRSKPTLPARFPNNKCHIEYEKREWENEYYKYGVRSGEICLWGSEAVQYKRVIVKEEWEKLGINVERINL